MPENHHEQQIGGVRTLSELGLRLSDAGAIREVLGAAYSLDGLIVQEADLDPAFLNLRSGLLGELFQTFTNHRLPLALVVPEPARHGERFAELAREHAGHALIRLLPTVEAARAWLARA